MNINNIPEGFLCLFFNVTGSHIQTNNTMSTLSVTNVMLMFYLDPLLSTNTVIQLFKFIF